ncbi:hypothetical protein [Anaerocolumna jejuensis]|uniref:hypothetical protein n=1 Tax=Anaerocolumna jejuensis TaxID=259063 RepID=UPI003F7CBBB9
MAKGSGTVYLYYYNEETKKVVKVDGNGRVTAAGAGTTAIITVIKLYHNETVIIKTKITVKKASISFTSSKST